MNLVTPSEGELFKKFSPELQQHNLENRERRQRDYEDFVGKLKEYSKSDKPIWVAAQEAQEKAREEVIRRQREEEGMKRRMRDEIRGELQGGR
jgi:biopolymer transport protein ExbB/TolQ